MYVNGKLKLSHFILQIFSNQGWNIDDTVQSISLNQDSLYPQNKMYYRQFQNFYLKNIIIKKKYYWLK
jgi:hypothetical protein